nr:uncharacterized protein LOC127482896 [Oryctolagus cuniculus]
MRGTRRTRAAETLRARGTWAAQVLKARSPRAAEALRARRTWAAEALREAATGDSRAASPRRPCPRRCPPPFSLPGPARPPSAVRQRGSPRLSRRPSVPAARRHVGSSARPVIILPGEKHEIISFPCAKGKLISPAHVDSCCAVSRARFKSPDSPGAICGHTGAQAEQVGQRKTRGGIAGARVPSGRHCGLHGQRARLPHQWAA